MSHDHIFANTAPRYWEQGLSVMPLHPHSKSAFVRGWQHYCKRMPDADTQREWLEHYPHYNIGLALGPASGLMMLDIDTDNNEIINLIETILEDHESPWKRIGSKGMALAFRFDGTRSFRILESGAKKPIVEVLSTGRQIVIPPSIHPDTGRAYIANNDLCDVLNQIPTMPPHFEERLRAALRQEIGIDLSSSGRSKTIDFISAGERDNRQTSTAGVYAHAVRRGEMTLKEAVQAIQAWSESFTEKVAGDSIDPKKGVERLVYFLVRDVVEKNRPLPKGWDLDLSDEEKETLGVRFDEDNVQWSFEEIKDYLRQRFEDIRDPDSTSADATVRRVLNLVSSSETLDSLQIDQIFRYIIDVCRYRASLTSLRKRVQEIRSGEIQGTDQTELAEETLKELQEFYEIRYDRNKFWRWTGAYWNELPEHEIRQVIQREFGTLPMAKRANDHRGIVDIMKQTCTKPLRLVEKNGVNFANGFLTEDMKLIEHDCDYGMTYVLPYRYAPERSGEAHRFRNFLFSVWGEDKDYSEKCDALQEALAATLMGTANKYVRVFLLQGVGGSGKSQLLDIVRMLLPDDAYTAIPPESWGDRFSTSPMVGKLLNVAGELSENKAINGKRFKEITGGDPIFVENKGKDGFHSSISAAHWFASNHMPKSTDKSSGFLRRWLIFPFTRPVPNSQKEIGLGESIGAEEREAIVAWALEGYERLIKNRDYTTPPSHTQAIRDLASANNSVHFFIVSRFDFQIPDRDPAQLNGHQLRTTWQVDPETFGTESSKTLISVEELFQRFGDFRVEMVGGVEHVKLMDFKSRIEDMALNYGLKRLDSEMEGQLRRYYDGLIPVEKKGK